MFAKYLHQLFQLRNWDVSKESPFYLTSLCVSLKTDSDVPYSQISNIAHGRFKMC